mmetsp:Transcript_834/g.2367  ORF Transcript_834/g.2367 Transcript_834/m.2367 type:complete len:266 (+) Transcript_834:1248-2045(+)
MPSGVKVFHDVADVLQYETSRDFHLCAYLTKPPLQQIQQIIILTIKHRQRLVHQLVQGEQDLPTDIHAIASQLVHATRGTVATQGTRGGDAPADGNVVGDGMVIPLEDDIGQPIARHHPDECRLCLGRADGEPMADGCHPFGLLFGSLIERYQPKLVHRQRTVIIKARVEVSVLILGAHALRVPQYLARAIGRAEHQDEMGRVLLMEREEAFALRHVGVGMPHDILATVIPDGILRCDEQFAVLAEASGVAAVDGCEQLVRTVRE